MPSVATDGLSVTHAAKQSGPPDLRLVHYNDVYHVEEGSAEPVGGVARFQSVIDHYRSDASFAGQPDILTFFSGDAYNPSLQSTVTKGRHMVPFLNKAGTDVACVGNHDLDFGVAQFRHLRTQCRFPWLLANVLDPALGKDVSIADCEKTLMLTASNGIKVGVIGLGEREWLGTINALPPNLVYKSAYKTALELVPRLREQGAELIVAVTHQREPNDYKLAEKLPPGTIDIILGGHDHFYAHAVVNGTHVLRSGTDFKQLSYIEAWRKAQGSGWDFNIVRRDIVRSIPEDPATLVMVDRLTSSLKAKLEKPIGYTSLALDGRFSTVRQKESNLGNFACDLMRFYYGADCAMMAGGTIRGDQIYPPGILRLKDILNCFPFEDPVVLVRLKGRALFDALENGVSQLPALEGRFPQVSNITFSYNPSAPSGSRVKWAKVGGEPIDYNQHYTLATRGYMARGKDGFASLLIESEGGEVEEIVDEESGILISTLLRQYFLSLKVVGKWRRWGPSMTRHWSTVHDNLHCNGWLKPPSSRGSPVSEKVPYRPSVPRSKQYFYGRFPEIPVPAGADGVGIDRENESMDSDSDTDPDILTSPQPTTNYVTLPARSATEEERRLRLARKATRTWMHRAGLQPSAINDADEVGEFTPTWTPGISPRLEGRIIIET
ncbi:putative 5'-nucleotidase [Aspergillus ibericus CBS 121593]|uniref:Metallo-dependent phosphatase n=1 Tax=Aspergillus ibericus CBS 121593 TaxID=1448316 RepID=A0A395H7Q5_9EURO|nr:Metallo-dependent phosphatase [Aspergillus ibericus CBS 121593]RAL03947.1 Metallo-dependent phosphatase [Aspergillus ibericus CBS 121593]